MCRLYGFRATEPTKVECSLVYAQNALLVQARGDSEGEVHGHGWGVATYDDGRLHVERQAWAAYHGEYFARAAARTYSRTVVAHVRQATVGGVALENTHPFSDGRWAFAHNGTIVGFQGMRERFLEAMSSGQRAKIAGTTDSEHLFRLLLSLRRARPERTLPEVLRQALELVGEWMEGGPTGGNPGLNVIWTDGRDMVASRWGRTLYLLERDGVSDCEVCGFPHVHHAPGGTYRAVALASEPLTDTESWREVPEGTLIHVDEEVRVRLEPWAVPRVPRVATARSLAAEP